MGCQCGETWPQQKTAIQALPAVSRRIIKTALRWGQTRNRCKVHNSVTSLKYQWSACYSWRQEARGNSRLITYVCTIHRGSFHSGFQSSLCKTGIKILTGPNKHSSGENQTQLRRREVLHHGHQGCTRNNWWARPWLFQVKPQLCFCSTVWFGW